MQHACDKRNDRHVSVDEHHKNSKTDSVLNTNSYQSPLTYLEGLSKLDRKKFRFNDPGMHKNPDEFFEIYDSLPRITEIPGYKNFDARYYSDLTFSDNFKVYVIVLDEGGDCWAAQTLLTCKGDSIITMKNIMQKCAWESHNSLLTTEFQNDSTFITMMTTREVAEDSTGYIPGVTNHRKTQETFVIQSTGKIKLIARSDTSWTEKINNK